MSEQRFAFYGRVSTEDQQDPEASRDWQLARARTLIDPVGGTIVAEYFDIGMSRSLPWKRRPEAARLLGDLARSDRGFSAVVIGEPQRAFYGNQFGLTFPVFTHYDVELWIPEVGGAVDPGSDAHDLVMALYGGMSKGERQRIKIRVRTAMTTQAQQGRFLGGRPPYGYRLVDAGPHPNPGKAAAGQRAHRLEVDETAAPIVQRIFAAYLDGKGIGAIAEALTRDGIPCPSAHDPARNRHRPGWGWSKSAVRSILRNPRYTGREVWNKQRKEEVLLDVDDVAAGHRTRQTWNDEDAWVFSTEQTHEAIIDVDTFTQAQLARGAGTHRPAVRTQRRVHEYVLRGMVRCGACHELHPGGARRMQGSRSRGVSYLRCKTTGDYPALGHPKVAYVREEHLVAAIDDWIAGLFDPDHIDDTVAALVAAQGTGVEDAARIDAARRRIADVDEKTARLVAAIEAGSPAEMMAGRFAELKAQRLEAEQILAAATPAAPWTPETLREAVEAIGDVREPLAAADAAVKARLYEELGLSVTFWPATRRVRIEALPYVLRSCRRGDGSEGYAPLVHETTLPAA